MKNFFIFSILLTSVLRTFSAISAEEQISSKDAAHLIETFFRSDKIRLGQDKIDGDLVPCAVTYRTDTDEDGSKTFILTLFREFPSHSYKNAKGENRMMLGERSSSELSLLLSGKETVTVDMQKMNENFPQEFVLKYSKNVHAIEGETGKPVDYIVERSLHLKEEAFDESFAKKQTVELKSNNSISLDCQLNY